MSKTITVYMPVDKDLYDGKKNIYFGDYPKTIENTIYDGIYFSYNLINAFDYALALHKEEDRKDHKILILEINPEDIFKNEMTGDDVVNKLKVIRELSINDIIDYFNNGDYEETRGLESSLKTIKSSQSIYWSGFIKHKESLRLDIQKFINKLESEGEL